MVKRSFLQVVTFWPGMALELKTYSIEVKKGRRLVKEDKSSDPYRDPFRTGAVYFVAAGSNPLSFDFKQLQRLAEKGRLSSLPLANYRFYFFGPAYWGGEELRAAAHHYLSEFIWPQLSLA